MADDPQENTASAAHAATAVPEFVHKGDLFTMELPPLRWLLDPFIVAEEGITLLHARWGSFKTPIAYAMGAAVATGSPLWGLSTIRARVLFVQVDTPKRVFFERARDLATLYGVKDDREAVYDIIFGYPGLDLLKAHHGEGTDRDKALYRRLRETHRKHKYDLVVIDSLRPLHTMTDIDSEVPPMVYRAVQQTFAGASIVLIHHDRKLSKDSLTEDHNRESFAGSQAWASHATVAVKIKRTGDSNEVKLWHNKSQAGPTLEEPLTLVMAGNLGVESREFYREAEATGLSGRALDLHLANRLGMKERAARDRRLGHGA